MKVKNTTTRYATSFLRKVVRFIWREMGEKVATLPPGLEVRQKKGWHWSGCYRCTSDHWVQVNVGRVIGPFEKVVWRKDTFRAYSYGEVESLVFLLAHEFAHRRQFILGRGYGMNPAKVLHGKRVGYDEVEADVIAMSVLREWRKQAETGKVFPLVGPVTVSWNGQELGRVER